METLELLTIVGQVSSDGLVEGLRGFFLPIILLVIGLAGVGFMAAQRMSGLIGFLVVAVLVVAIITVPGVIENFGRWIGNALS